MAIKNSVTRVAVVVITLLCVRSIAQDLHHHHEDAGEHTDTFGHVNFPTSCSQAVQPQFETAVAAMHSFEYTSARKRFQAIEKQDPACAIAYWGDAMTLFHQLWGPPKENDRRDGWSLVKKAQAAKKTSPREKAYIAAAAAYFKPGDQSNDQRATDYSTAMETLHSAYPDDEEGTVFYALSILAAEPPTDTDLAYPKKAVAILNQVLAKDPNHPGVTHYIIHACDNPIMAPQALEAARQYAKIAPASPHAVHMPSHIFARLGLWQESINSNLAAVEVAKKSSGIEYQLHPMDFLLYAYLQTGQEAKARALEAEAVSMKHEGYGRGVENFYYYVQAHFPAMLAIETRDWKTAESLKPPAGAPPGFAAITYVAQAQAAGHLKDVPVARTAVKNLEEELEAERKENPKDARPPVDTDLNEGKAWLAYAQGNYDEAFALLKPVIERQDQVGKGEVELPAREMYAEMLLDAGRSQEALEQYQLSLKSDPNRFNGLYGAALAAEKSKQPDLASTYYKQLLSNCGEAGEQRAELKHARESLSQSQGGAN